MFGHVIGYVIQELVRDHVMSHVIPSQGHVPISQGHMGEFLSSLFGCNLALGSGWVDLGLSRAIPS